MQLKTLKGIGTREITSVFNASFADYFIPFNLTEAQLAAKMRADKTDLELSVGVFEKGQLIGFVLHGFDSIQNEQVVYNGGTGVIPKKRGAGLTKQMYHFILPVLIEKGIDRLILEVISENIQAIKSYKKSGFRVKRQLVCYKGTVEIANMNTLLEIVELQHYNWDLMTSFWDVTPTWQNAIHIVNEIRDTTVSLGAFRNNQLVGYVIYNPASKRIQQLAVNKNCRRIGIGTALLSKLTAVYGNKMSVINVDKRSKETNRFFTSIGLEPHLEQLEMEFEL